MNRTESYVHWRIERTGELVMWGTGTVHIDYADFGALDYEFVVVDEDVEWNDITYNYHVLLADHLHDPDGGNYCGFVVGDVNHKMMPEASPDISALTVDRFDDVDGEVLS